jgi:hypothetical protein
VGSSFQLAGGSGVVLPTDAYKLRSGAMRKDIGRSSLDNIPCVRDVVAPQHACAFVTCEGLPIDAQRLKVARDPVHAHLANSTACLASLQIGNGRGTTLLGRELGRDN